jgi:hypothetical protein
VFLRKVFFPSNWDSVLSEILKTLRIHWDIKAFIRFFEFRAVLFLGKVTKHGAKQKAPKNGLKQVYFPLFRGLCKGYFC